MHRTSRYPDQSRIAGDRCGRTKDCWLSCRYVSPEAEGTRRLSAAVIRAFACRISLNIRAILYLTRFFQGWLLPVLPLILAGVGERYGIKESFPSIIWRQNRISGFRIRRTRYPLDKRSGSPE